MCMVNLIHSRVRYHAIVILTKHTPSEHPKLAPVIFIAVSSNISEINSLAW